MTGYRNIFRTAATTLKNFGLFYAGDFLANSLNDNPKTIIFVDFLMKKKDDIPNLSQIRMNQPPMIRKGKIIYNYD